MVSIDPEVDVRVAAEGGFDAVELGVGALEGTREMRDNFEERYVVQY